MCTLSHNIEIRNKESAQVIEEDSKITPMAILPVSKHSRSSPELALFVFIVEVEFAWDRNPLLDLAPLVAVFDNAVALRRRLHRVYRRR